MKHLAVVLFLCLLAQTASAQEKKKDYPITPVSFTAVQVTDDFWGGRIRTNREVTLPYAFQKCEETGRIRNFEVAGGLQKGKFEGLFFNDSDVYKVIEGAAYALKQQPNEKLEAYVDGIVEKIAAAQWPDGYIDTFFSIPEKQPNKRFKDMSQHEDYCAGHLYEAAVAYYQATGKRKLLDVAIRSANHLCNQFGPSAQRDVPGHEEVELALIKLYRQTGDAKYLKTAKFLLDERGHANKRHLGGEYSQDHKPVVEQDAAVGHAVRAAYLYSGMADIAALTGDPAYRKALDKLWKDVVGKKLYLTGGIGARGGIEGFGDPYVLPNPAAYNETCAAIALALWSHRMFLLTGDSQYVDVLERVLYNGFLSGYSLKGDRFFYPNPLEDFRGRERSPWFDCSCCPSNVVRFIPSIPGYAYAHDAQGVYVNLFMAGKALIDSGEQTVEIEQETRYPWEGEVKFTINPAKGSKRFALLIRIPGWAQGQVVPSDLYRYLDNPDSKVTLRLNGQSVPLDIRKGYAVLSREWKKGDRVELALPMPVRRVEAHEAVKDDKGRVALERGPIVFCAEFADNKNGQVLNLVLEDNIPLKAEFQPDLLNGVMTIKGQAEVVRRTLDGKIEPVETTLFKAIPYYAWAHRGVGPMTVWLAREPQAAKPLPADTLAHTSKITVSSGGTVDALTDQLEPTSSNDHSTPYFHWWPKKGTSEWVQLEFKKPETISEATIYWFDDTGIGECRLPQSWRLTWKNGDQWKPVENTVPYGTAKDRYNTTSFKPVTTSAIRFEIQLPKDFSAGIQELSIK
jgi:DUF1680 family protein